MSNKYNSYMDISKKARNGMKARIELAVNKYGFEVFRKCSLKYIEDIKKKGKLQQEIEEREKELAKLKKQNK